MTDKGLTGHKTDQILLELVDNTMLTLEVNEKAKATLVSDSVPWAYAFTKEGNLGKGITTLCVGIEAIPKTH